MSDPNLQFFTYAHLPENLQEISKKFAELAKYIDSGLPSNGQSSEAIRHLLRAKDCAVRAKLYKSDQTCMFCGDPVVKQASTFDKNLCGPCWNKNYTKLMQFKGERNE